MSRRPDRRRSGWLLMAVVAGLLSACSPQAQQSVSLCGPTGQLRVGYVGADEGRARGGQAVLPDAEISRLRDLLTVASRCDVQLEPVASPEQARLRLGAAEWDAAFLPAGLAALALEGAGSGDYSLVRPLGQRRQSRAQLLVRADSERRSLGQLKGARLGLLPRGSLTGFYLPLYNLHGLSLSSVHYALSYSELLEQLRSGKLDVIVWDSALPEPGGDVRVVLEDRNSVPLGALVLSQGLVAADHQPFLRGLDASASQLPPSLGYVAGVLPEAQELQRLRAVVNSVESWDLPLEGRSYAVYGQKQELAPAEAR
jgi:phosphonate transport system substrate-binding protein